MNINCKMKLHKIIIFILLSVSLFECRKTDVRVKRRDNEVYFNLQNNENQNVSYIIGHTNKPNSVIYENINIFGYSYSNVNSWGELITLSKDDDYFFSVTTPDYAAPSFTMQIKVHGKLYKEIVVSNPIENFTYTISGKLETTKK